MTLIATEFVSFSVVLNIVQAAGRWLDPPRIGYLTQHNLCHFFNACERNQDIVFQFDDKTAWTFLPYHVNRKFIALADDLGCPIDGSVVNFRDCIRLMPKWNRKRLKI